MENYRLCLCFTRTFKATVADPPEEVKHAFRKYADGGAHMTAEQFQRFLVDVQHESGSDAQRIMEQVLQRRRPIAKLTRHYLTLDDFHHYLFSAELNPPIGSEVHQDMKAPMSHYFIFTGHNSYLTGNQLSSNCSDVPIIKALNRGVRVVELDIWPNSAKDNVLVLHGRTLTTPVELVKCLRSIKDHAFSASPYPVIITLEDHLTPDLQDKVAKMLTQTFGDMLYYPKSEIKEFPSPEDLKYKVIISSKPPKEYLETKTALEEGDGLQNNEDSDEDDWRKEAPDLKVDRQQENESEVEPSEHNQDIEESDGCELESCPSVGPVYKSLISIQVVNRKDGLKQALKVEIDKVRRLSLSEQALEKATNSHSLNIVRFTQQNFLRVFPKFTRFNSSNYKPFIGWMHGAQMVAFNMQGYGKHLWLMHGMFRANGGCGYVRKPELLMNDNLVFDPKAERAVQKTLRVKLYMGDGWHLDFKQTDFDMYSPPDFYARVGIAGVPADTVMKKTKTKEDNWNPIWNEEFTFPLTVPELALLRIEVHEYNVSEKDNFAGQTVLPVWELKQGIRAVPLHDRKGEKFSSVRLLMGFEFI